MLRWLMAGLLLVATLSGCPGIEEDRDATAVDVYEAVGGTDPTPTRADNPFLGGLDGTWNCERTVCPPGDDPYLEMKAWVQAHEDCAPIPAELRCRVRSQLQGIDWPETQDALIDAAATASGGFTEEQVEALRCLGALDSVGAFRVYSWNQSKVPESILPDALITLDPSVDTGTAFERAFGPAIGAALAIGPDYSFRSDVSTYRMTWVVETWKGVAIDGRLYVEAQVDSEPSWGPTSGVSCPGRFRLVSIETNLARGIEDVDVVPTITPKEAEAVAVEGGCWFDKTEDGARETELFVSNWNDRGSWELVWRVRVMCGVQESCGSFDVPFDVRVEAHSGAVYSKIMDAAIDCF